MDAYVKKFGVVAVGLAVLYVVIAMVVAVWVYSSAKSFVVGNLGWEERTGSFLAWGAMLLFTGGGFAATARILFFGSRNPVHYLFAILPAAVPWVLGVAFEKPVRPDGTVRLFCNKRPQLFCRIVEDGQDGGFDPITADRLHVATPKERRFWADGGNGKKVPPPEMKPNPCAERAFFSEDGAIVWYYVHDGRIELFDDSGKHPTYGEPLIPITKAVVLKLESICAAQKVSAAQPAEKPAAPLAYSAPKVSPVQPTEPAAPSPSARYLNHRAIQGLDRVDPVVIKGNFDAAREVIDVMGVRLQQGVFTPAFVSEGLFDRALQGDADAIARLQLPGHIRKIVLVQVGEPQRSTMPDAQNSIKVAETVHVAVVEARSGVVLDSARFVAEGMGFGEQYVQQSLREDLSKKLAAVKRAL